MRETVERGGRKGIYISIPRFLSADYFLAVFDPIGGLFPGHGGLNVSGSFHFFQTDRASPLPLSRIVVPRLVRGAAGRWRQFPPLQRQVPQSRWRLEMRASRPRRASLSAFRRARWPRLPLSPHPLAYHHCHLSGSGSPGVLLLLFGRRC